MSVDEESSHQTIDINKLSTSLSEELANMRPSSKNCCIYTFPKRVRGSNELDYTPQLVSIGPIHHGKPQLKPMEEHKKRHLHDFLVLSQVSIEDYVNVIEKKETRLRDCYAEFIELNRAEYVRMVLFDATFIIMVFLEYCRKFEMLITSEFEQRLVSKKEFAFGNKDMVDVLRNEMLMLENQLPFFILEDLYSLSKIKDIIKVSMIELASNFRKIKNVSDSSDVKHLLDFLRSSFVPQEWQPQRNGVMNLRATSIEKLHQAGVKFKCGSDKNIFDIKFNDGFLEIPPFSLIVREEILLRNLIAYEQYHGLGNFFGDYIAVLNQLISTAGDAELLVDHKIINNAMIDVRRLPVIFSNLQSDNIVFFDHFVYCKLMEDLNKYYNDCRRKRKARLKQKYAKAKFGTFSVGAAFVILIILTIIQTVCSIIQLR